jgi:hypothetical protein
MQRTCIGCGQTDDHPRHVIAVSDGSEVTWHFDCHRIAVNCESCTAQTKGAEKLRGDKLREHLTKGG